MRARTFDRERVTVDVVVKALHTELSPALREATHAKVASVERFASDVRLVEVEFSDETTRRNDHAHTCEILVHLRRRLVKGVASSGEQTVALDAAVEKVTQQMRKLHRRRLDARHGGPHRTARGVAGNGPESADVDLELDGEVDDDRIGAGRLEIVRTKRFATKPMDSEEAALQMELLGHDFFLFTSSESGHCAVIYRRRDGRLGLIEATG
jgi:putative sigma-54 modulation protein